MKSANNKRQLFVLNKSENIWEGLTEVAGI